MKSLTIMLSCLLLWQQPKPVVFDDFILFATRKYVLLNEENIDCNWKYAYIKLKRNKLNKVVGYSILNDVSDSLKSSFKYLVGYQFPKNADINQRPIVFLFTINNMRQDCKIPRSINYSPSDMVQMLYFYLDEQARKNPGTIVIYKPAIITMSGPTP